MNYTKTTPGGPTGHLQPNLSQKTPHCIKLTMLHKGQRCTDSQKIVMLFSLKEKELKMSGSLRCQMFQLIVPKAAAK